MIDVAPHGKGLEAATAGTVRDASIHEAADKLVRRFPLSKTK